MGAGPRYFVCKNPIPMPRSFLTGLFVLALLLALPAQAQFIAQPQPIQGVCPTLCPGSTFGISLPAVQDLGSGTEILTELSDPNGSFASGTTILPSIGWTLTLGGSFTSGTYRFTGTVNNLQLQFRIPNDAPAGNGYTLRMRTSAGYRGQTTLQCVGSQFTVLPGGPRLASVPQNTFGQNRWFAHLYTWDRPSEEPLDSIAANNYPFFQPDKYLGHVVYDPLSLDKTFTGIGYPNTDHQGTSLACEVNYPEYFSLRLLRRHSFDTGYYAFTIAGDDGIRFSIDSGRSWLLSSFQEQPYAGSRRTTQNSYPQGICLAGPRPLAIEFFQSGLDSRLTLDVVRVPPPVTLVVQQAFCEGQVLSLSSGFPPEGNRFQWQISTDAGATYSNLSDTGSVTGSQRGLLEVFPLPLGWDGARVRCLVYNNCARQGFVSAQTNLTVQPGVFVRKHPVSRTVCPGDRAGFGIRASGPDISYQWEVSDDGGNSFTEVSGTAYEGTTTDSLIWNIVPYYSGRRLFRCRVQGLGACIGPFYSDTAALRVFASLALLRQPEDLGICYGDSSVFTVEARGANLRYQWERGQPGSFEPIGGYRASLAVYNAPLESVYYRCRVESDCGPALYTREALLQPCVDSCAFPALPNILTANNDGLNELFASYPACGYESYDLRVYNRWGRLVFTTQDRQGWRPQSLPSGTYFFRLQYRYFGRDQERHGLVEIVR